VCDKDIRSAIISFVQSYHAKNKTVPSIRMISKAFEADGVNRYTFYSLFPNGLRELCKLTAVPAPTERIRRTDRATEASKLKGQSSSIIEVSPDHLMLSEAQTKRLLGLSHLEDGKDPLLIIDELLDRDSKLRMTCRLSFKGTKAVADFLELATSRGWEVPPLLSMVMRMWNSGFMHLDQHSLKCLSDMLTEMKSRGLTPKELVETLNMKQGEFEANIQQAYDAGFKNGLETFENAYMKSVLSISKDYDTLRWLYKIGNLTRLQALADRSAVSSKLDAG
jgi:hypothetical protein